MIAFQDELQNLVREWPDSAAGRLNLSSDLAELLEWNTGRASSHTFSLDRLGLSATKTYVQNRSAALFVVGEGDADSLLSHAALYAYHASIRWGMAASRDGAVVFNSHWLDNGCWFHLPLIRWSELPRPKQILSELTPEAIISGRVDKKAAQFRRPDAFLRPVDDELVGRLDHWRAEAMRYAEAPDRIDSELQNLFAQLFVLRTVEDKGLAPELPALETLLEAASSDLKDSLEGLISRAGEIIGSELFTSGALGAVPLEVVPGIIRDLYVPHNLPRPARYHFDWIDADVLGTAYEKYLSTVLRSGPPPKQLSFFGQPKREAEYVSVRKEAGVYYTPNFLVEYLVERSLEEVGFDGDLNAVPTIVDFSCGSGSFLVAAADALIRRLRGRDPERNWARELIGRRVLVGLDIDERAVTLARLALWIRFAQEPDPFPLPDLEETIRQGNALIPESWEGLPDGYDIVVGNPPFIALPDETGGLDLSDFESATGRFDFAYLFLELGVRLLRPDGAIGMVIPNRLFRNRHAEAIRRLVTRQTYLISVVDFGDLEVFTGTSAYIGALIARKTEDDTGDMQNTRAVFVRDLGVERYLGARLAAVEHARQEVENGDLVAHQARYPVGGNPWLLLSDTAIQERVRLEQSSQRLDEVALIVQGIRTGANDVFILTGATSEEEQLVKVRNGLDEAGTVERTILRACATGSDIQRYQVVRPRRLLLYPHRGGDALDERTLLDEFPEAHEYLSRYRSALRARAGIAGTGRGWYELVWPRNENWLASPKLLIRDLAPQPAFAVDAAGQIFNVGGTAVIPQEGLSLLALLTYLNSPLVDGYLRPSTPTFRGGFQKFEPRHISSIPIPTLLLDDTNALVIQLEDLAKARLNPEVSTDEMDSLEATIDAVLSEALGLS